MSAREHSHLHGHFQDLETQRHASQLGMWIVLAGELMMFSALFTLYGAYRLSHPEAFAAAAGHTDLLLGTVNTYVLVGASFLVALALHRVRADRGRDASHLLWAAAGLGVLFLVLKAVEYSHHMSEGIFPGQYYGFAELPGEGAAAFFGLYYLLTGVHGLHVLGGVGLLGWLAWRCRRGAWGETYHTPVELGGMYWHFVDVVWLFLWPSFYLMR